MDVIFLAVVVFFLMCGALFLAYKIHDKCPRCFTKMEHHSLYPNAMECPACHYIRVND